MLRTVVPEGGVDPAACRGENVSQPPHSADVGLSFYCEQQDSRRFPGPALKHLVDLYRTAATEGSVHVALLWPGGLQAIPLVHSLACFALWSDGYKRGVRGLFYPAKQNTFHPLNHIYVSRAGIAELANKIHEFGPNPLIKESCKDKDTFLFAVNSLKKALPEDKLRPSINEILPHFSMLRPGDQFEDYSGRFYSRLRSKLERRAHSKALVSTTFPGLGSPDRAPDALFALGYSLTPDDVKKSLRTLQKLGAPKVVLLDGTKRATKGIPDWRKRFVKLIHQVKDAFAENAPGVLLVTDDPRQLSQFYGVLAESCETAKRPLHFQPHGIVYTHVDTGLSDAVAEPPPEVPERKVTLLLTDSEIGNLVDQLVPIAKRLDDQSTNSEPVWDAVRFLSKLSHIPGSLSAMWEYIHAKNLATHERERFDWQYYRGRLLNFAVNHDSKDERPLIEQCIRVADRLVEAYTKSTPLGLKVQGEIQRANGQGKQPTVVVRGPMHRAVLSTFLNNQGYTTAEQRIVLIDELDAICKEGCAGPLIFADLTSDILRRVVADPMMADEIVLTLTFPMARELKYTIEPLLNMPEFEVFHPRLKVMANKLEKQLQQQGITLLEDGLAGVSSFTLSGYEGNEDDDVADKDAVLVAFENGPLLKKGKHSVLYVYDPEQAEDGYSGFRRVTAEKLEKGQQVFLMSAELRELMEGILAEHGIKVGCDVAFEAGLRQYHQRISASVSKKFRGTRAALCRWLQDQMLALDPTIQDEIRNVRHWVDLGHSPDTPFEQLSPQAPRSLRAFKAFCQVLGISNAEISFFWDFVIKPLRGSRRKAGRWLSDVYTGIIFDPDSAMAYAGISRETISMLRRKATDQTFIVSDITPLE